MGEEVNNNENKKKQKLAILVGIVTLLIAVLGATYAYFQINTGTESSSTKITGRTPNNGLVTLEGVTNNLHLNISVSDMSLDKQGTEYYADDDIENNYVLSEGEGTHTIAKVGITDGEETTKYSCTAKLTVSKIAEPEDQKDTMIEVLQPGDIILQFKGNILNEQLDLSKLNPDGSKEYNLTFRLTGSTKEEIQAYIKLINKDAKQNESQNYLAGRKLNIDITTSDLKCEVFIQDPKVAQLKAKDKEVSGIEHISDQGGMYRYQGTYDVPNWILFGTREKCEKDEEEKCTNSKLNNMRYDEYVDKYMYRIIGITEEGQMYLLKETFLKEGETTNTFEWNYTTYISDCLGDTCEWPNSDIYKILNGTASNGNPIFVNSTQYEYLKSGDENGTSDGKGSEWYQLIADHNWMYGDTNEEDNVYNGDTMYAIETGNTPTKRWWPDEEQGQETCSSDNQCTEKPYTWSKSTKATKIGLMYMHDIDYAYYDGNNPNTRGNPESWTDITNSWIHFQKDGYNTSNSDEWLITRFGVYSTSREFVCARTMDDNGGLTEGSLNNFSGARPVFYLTSDVSIDSGDGTKANPYILA